MVDSIRVFYSLDNFSIREVQGGFAARAFVLVAPNRKYFLKCYDKKRPCTERNIAGIDIYTPILEQLSNGSLGGNVPTTIYTSSGKNRCEDDEFVYLMYDFIDGDTIAANPYGEQQITALGGIMAKLHCHKTSHPLDSITERFEIPFNDKLHAFINASLTEDFKFLVEYKDAIIRLCKKTAELAEAASAQDTEFVLCHTDVHGWNLMQTETSLILIDWEGLRFAPREADFFAFENLPFKGNFIAEYNRVCLKNGIKPYRENNIILDFYHSRRKSEDIWEFIEKLLFEQLSEEQHRKTVCELIEECMHI